MWRFILLTFAFLGWSFYELSGGADYEPRTQSLQARATLDDVRPIARPVRVNVIRLAENDAVPEAETVTRSVTSLADLDLKQGERFEITLASVDALDDTHDVTVPVVSAEPAKPEPAVAETPKPEIVESEMSEPFVDEPLSDEVKAAIESLSLANLPRQYDIAPVSTDQDIRQVTGNVVNMRGGPGTGYEKVAQLAKGTDVAVLRESGEGWIKLRVVDTGRVGWVADWLVTAAAN